VEPGADKGVAKSRKKTRKPKCPTVAEKPVALEPMNPEALRGHISGLVRVAAVGMVTTTIERVKEGQYQAMKYLFEMIGLFPATAPPDMPQDESLAEMLLSRLGIPENSGSDRSAAKNQPVTRLGQGEQRKMSERWI
jgi:hypothetical protein